MVDVCAVRRVPFAGRDETTYRAADVVIAAKRFGSIEVDRVARTTVSTSLRQPGAGTLLPPLMPTTHQQCARTRLAQLGWLGVTPPARASDEAAHWESDRAG